MDLLLDTQILVWIGLDDKRLSQRFRETLIDPTVRYFISSVVAYEFEDLRLRHRLGDIDTIDVLVSALPAVVLPYPAEAYRLLPLIPLLHRDPVDRMLIAHAIHADLTLVTADADICEYPVRTLW